MLATEGFIRDPRHEIDILVEEDDVDPMYEEIGDAIDVPVLIFRDGQVVYSESITDSELETDSETEDEDSNDNEDDCFPSDNNTEELVEDNSSEDGMDEDLSHTSDSQ